MTSKHLHIFPDNKRSEQKLSQEEKIKRLETLFQQVLETLEIDLTDPSIAKTPKRMANMYVKELFSGLQEENFPIPSLYATSTTGMVLIKDIPLFSICEHHFLPMIGTAYFAYFPNKTVIGLSKVNRIVHFFSRRPQLQERLTEQIGNCLSFHLKTTDIVLLTRAKHLCLTARGVRDQTSITEVLHVQGRFKEDDNIKKEFLSLCQ